MAGGLWGNERKGSSKGGDKEKARSARRFKEEHKENNFILTDIDRQLREWDRAINEERDQDHLHASEICKSDWCPRASCYRIEGYAPDFAAKRGNVSIYVEGHEIHDRYQRAAWALGRLTGIFICEWCKHRWWGTSPQHCPVCRHTFLKYGEVPIEDEDIILVGHGDGIFEPTEGSRYDEQVLGEIKSVGEGTVRIEAPALYRPYQDGEIGINQLWQSIRRPFATHIRQINLYLRALKFKHAVALYEFKPNQARKEFWLTYSPDVIEPIVEQAHLVKVAVRKGTLVRRPDWADEGQRTCAECPYRKRCWK